MTGWSRRYPPLVAVFAALALVLFALPSALNLPQANPGQTTEYAPVPGENGNAPPSGNLAALGLGQGEGTAGGSLLPPPPPQLGQGAPPSAKDCVGSPPRETEDRLSPPCVAFFTGDNGGATHQGVTRNQVTVVFYADPDFQYGSCNQNSAPPNTYYDMASQPASSENTCLSSILRVWQRYFNYRFQTYNRTVHFWLYFGSGAGGNTEVPPAQRQAEAADNVSRLHPFAVVPLYGFVQDGNVEAYEAAAMARGVMVFTSASFEPATFYNSYAPLLWGYAASLDEQVSNFASYVCTKVKGNGTDYAGTVANGAPRVYGLIKTTDPGGTALRAFQDAAEARLKACGINFVATATYPVDGYAASTQGQANDYASQQMAVFATNHVTTIIWPGGFETNYSKAAASIGYLPEWLLAGDGTNDRLSAGIVQDSRAWAHAWVVSPQALQRGTYPEDCQRAYESVDYSGAFTQYGNFACYFYPSIRQLFTGIQVAGPRLTPQSVDSGFHAIPPYQSNDPASPTCYYHPGDYTCVKDAQASWWDSTTPQPANPGGAPGCYRVAEGGQRHTAGRWPPGNVGPEASGDPCNRYDGGVSVNILIQG